MSNKDNNAKHAYLLIAHNEFELLCKIVSLLDHEDNDIYIHIDKKSKTIPFEKIESSHKKSQLFYTDRIKVNWGGYSMIKAELMLIQKALEKGDYQYLHLLSGVDLPLKKQSYIHRFFADNYGKEFIHFNDEQFNQKHKTRYSIYHCFQEYVGRKKTGLLYYIERALCRFQKIINLDRSIEGVEYKGGAQWFSITEDLAKYVLENKKFIKKAFSRTTCCDEFFLQTIVYNSPFFKNVYRIQEIPSYISCLRYVDWKRGQPYTFQDSDVDDLLNSEYLFARKFSISSEKNRKCVDTIYDRLSY